MNDDAVVVASVHYASSSNDNNANVRNDSVVGSLLGDTITLNEEDTNLLTIPFPINEEGVNTMQ